MGAFFVKEPNIKHIVVSLSLSIQQVNQRSSTDVLCIHARPRFPPLHSKYVERNYANVAAKKKSQEKIKAPFKLNNTALTLHILHNLRRQCTLIREAHLRREGAVRHPLGRVPRRRLFHHAVHLFERKTLGLWDEEVRVDERDGTEAAPDEEDFGAEVASVRVDHVGGDDGDDL